MPANATSGKMVFSRQQKKKKGAVASAPVTIENKFIG
jgi:hypothetical protein